MLTYRQDGEKEENKMAKRIIRSAISIVPCVEEGKIICCVLDEKALMKINTGKPLTESDMLPQFSLSMLCNNTIVLHNGQFAYLDNKIVCKQ